MSGCGLGCHRSRTSRRLSAPEHAVDVAHPRGVDAAEKAGKSVEDVVRTSLATIPAARYGAPQEFAAVVAFLASERASYVTGSVVRVDGGLIRSL